MIRGLEGALCAAAALGLHLAGFALWPQAEGTDAAGASGTAAFSVAAVPPGYTALAEAWQQSPAVGAAPARSAAPQQVAQVTLRPFPATPSPAPRPAALRPSAAEGLPRMPEPAPRGVIAPPIAQPEAPDASALRLRQAPPAQPMRPAQPQALGAPQRSALPDIPAPAPQRAGSAPPLSAPSAPSAATSLPSPRPAPRPAVPQPPTPLDAPQRAALPQVDVAPPGGTSLRPVLRPPSVAARAPAPQAKPPEAAPRAAQRAAGAGARAPQAGNGAAALRQGTQNGTAKAAAAAWGGAIRSRIQGRVSSVVPGSVRLTVEVTRNGRVQGVSVLRSSGHASLDRAALRAARTRMPRAPKGIVQPYMRFQVTVKVN